MQIKLLKFILFFIAFLLPRLAFAAPLPVLNFSDIISGPKTGNTDGAGGLDSSQHGAIVTIWGNYLGSEQGTSKINFKDSNGVTYEAAHVYYWKNADGQLPGGPADLYTFHKMQEIAFSIPSQVASGMGEISVMVGGIKSTVLPFEIRSGDIKFIRSNGDDLLGDGSWDNPWATINNTVAGGNEKISAGDLIYSDGVGENSGIAVGANTAIAGTDNDHISIIAYPNTRVNVSGYDVQSTNPYTIAYYNNGPNENPYWNWSKISVTTSVSGISVVRDNRIVGVEITGPTVYDGRGGAIGGNCGDVIGCTSSEGGKYYGLYIHNYGTDNGVLTFGNNSTLPPYPPSLKNTWDAYQHLYNISNRSGLPIKAFEIAWNHITNNPIYHGIYINERLSCGDWNSPIKIHHNTIKNQRGFAINIDTSNCAQPLLVPFEINDNIIVQNPIVSYSGSALRINTPTTATEPLMPLKNNKIYNNNFFGYIGSSNKFESGNTDFVNNIVVDRANLNFFDGIPASNSNNLFYSTFGISAPSWATNGSFNSNPLFKNDIEDDFELSFGSPAIKAGSNETLLTSPRDFYGQARKADEVDVGAIHFTDLIAPRSPGNLSVN